VKKTNIAILTVFLSLIIIVFLIFLNDIIIFIRLNELKANLYEQDRRESSLDHIGLVATYQIHKNIYEKKITQENADVIEERVLSLVNSEEKEYSASIPIKYKIISRPALMIINFNRGIIGKNPLTFHLADERHLTDLDLAYYYERNFLFTKAIIIYDKVLNNRTISSTLKASVMLHQGYCYALAGMNEKAMNIYSTIINKFSQESSAITASILSRYLEGFKLAREKVIGSNVDPLIIGQDLVNLLAYEQALKILEDAVHKAKQEDIPRIKYFLARCFTGLGKPEKAVENYLQVIASSPYSQYAKYSNRKLFIIGERAGGENEIIAISKQLNGKLNDPLLSEMIQNQKDSPEPSENIKKLDKINISKNLLENVKRISTEGEISHSPGTYLIIQTSDGNTFKGALIEQNSKEIALQTTIGRINVKRDKITNITKK
jgi:tetratricopeptide (TPR) repeat protein